MPSLFDPFDLGHVRLANRIVMAPMTRSRARNSELAPDADVALYYAQRAGAGLIVSEGAPISVQGRGWAFTPGIYTPAQIVGWRNVADAVHAKGAEYLFRFGMWAVPATSHIRRMGRHLSAPSISRLKVLSALRLTRQASPLICHRASPAL